MPTNEITSYNPFTGAPLDVVSLFPTGSLPEALERAQRGQVDWAHRRGEERATILRAYAELLEENKEELAHLISSESGKPLWESRTEVGAMVNKVGLSIEAESLRCGDRENGPSRTRFHPLGTVAVLGPYNFPGHLPNGHLVPALLAGNAVLFKPSEQTPLVGAYLGKLFQRAGIPEDCLQVLQGGSELGQAIVQLQALRGLFFTGSARAGLSIHRALAGRPQTLLALEMGGNNPLIIDQVAGMEAASRIVCQSAFVTSGQRCTCARRLLVPRGKWGDQFLEQLLADMQQMSVGDPLGSEEHYLGAMISEAAADGILQKERSLMDAGAQPLQRIRQLPGHPAALAPGLVDVSSLTQLDDEECFGPLLQLLRYEDLDEALHMANDTEYGLAAGILTDSRETYDKAYARLRAGLINWNTPLTGASSAAPFGGVGLSGNYRPSAYLAADYCAYPTASLEKPELPEVADLPGFPRRSPNAPPAR